MKFRLFPVLLCAACAVWSQTSALKPAQPADISGLYSFLHEGEFLQLNVDTEGKVKGIVSHFGELESDRGAPLDHIIVNGTREGDRLAFTTRALHGTWFEFKGVVARGKGKSPAEEAYYLLRGTLTQYFTDAAHQTTARSRDVEFKSLPQDENAATRKRD